MQTMAAINSMFCSTNQREKLEKQRLQSSGHTYVDKIEKLRENGTRQHAVAAASYAEEMPIFATAQKKNFSHF
jgi:hypothetical protein